VTYTCDHCVEGIDDGALSYHCWECRSYDLCGKCWMEANHNNFHRHPLKYFTQVRRLFFGLPYCLFVPSIVAGAD
jgi:DNA primase large subunit